MSSQTRSPGTAANIDRDSKTDWVNVDNVKTDDSNNADNTAAAATYTDYLRVTNFGFTIPVDATIDGIVVEYDIYQSNTNWQDSSVVLVFDASIVSEDKATATVYSDASGTYQSRGAVDNTWSWGDCTVANINSSTFGFQVSALNTHKTQPRQGYVRHMRVTIYYTEAAPPVSASTHTYFKTPLFRDGVRTTFIYQSGQFNVHSGMRKTSVTATTWILAPISSSSSYFYPSGMVDGGVWIWVSGSYMGGGI